MSILECVWTVPYYEDLITVQSPLMCRRNGERIVKLSGAHLRPPLEGVLIQRHQRVSSLRQHLPKGGKDRIQRHHAGFFEERAEHYHIRDADITELLRDVVRLDLDPGQVLSRRGLVNQRGIDKELPVPPDC